MKIKVIQSIYYTNIHTDIARFLDNENPEYIISMNQILLPNNQVLTTMIYQEKKRIFK